MSAAEELARAVLEGRVRLVVKSRISYDPGAITYTEVDVVVEPELDGDGEADE